MENSFGIVPRFFLATIFLVIVAAYVASHKLPLIWHLLDLVAFFGVLLVSFPASKPKNG